MEKRRNFTGYAEVTFSDGNTLVLTEEDFTVSNNSITDAAGASGMPLGVAVCKTIQIEIANPNDKYSDYDFFGAKILYKLRFKLSETTESFNIGEFTVLDPQTYGETIMITALDNMYKANEYYATSLTFPATIGQMLIDICSTYDIPLETTSFANDDFIISERPAGNYIVRNLIGYIAMIAGGNARINRNGYLEIVSYDFSINDVVLSGGSFSPWTEGDEISGGTLDSWSEEEELSGGIMSERPSYHVFRRFKNLKVDTDAVLITGVQMEKQVDETTETVLNGTEGYILAVENPLVSGQEETFLDLLGSALIGGQMRRFEGDHLAYPLAEFMDSCLIIDRKGNVYSTILTDIDFTFFNFTTLKNSAESPEASRLKYTPAQIDTIKVAKTLVEAEKTEREKAIENLNKTLSNSSGMYSTDVEQEDGSSIRYFHDKKTLEESQNVIKITSEAIGFSQNGGDTYPYGITLNGETVTKLLYAEGINADYINAGTVKAERIKLEGIITVDGNIKVLEDGTLEAVNGKFSGDITGNGKIVLVRKNEAAGTVDIAKIEMAESVFTYNPFVFEKNENGIYEVVEDEYVIVNGQPCLVVTSGYGIDVGDLNATGVYARSVQFEEARGRNLRAETSEICNLTVYNDINIDGKSVKSSVGHNIIVRRSSQSTSASGNIGLGLDATKYVLLAAFVYGDALYYSETYTNASGIYGIHVKGAGGAVASNTTVNFVYAYVEK